MKGCDIDYRPGEIEDLDMLAEMERRSFDERDRFTRSTIKRCIINPTRSCILDVIQKDGEPIGYAVFLARRGSRRLRLYSICILDEFAGKGFARAYMEKRIRTFKDFDEISLEVRRSNLRAIALYEHMGFKPESVLDGYYPDGEDGLRMIRRFTD